MSERIDHAAESRRNIEGLHDYQSEAGVTEASMLTVAIEAQAHATLALVEQQRLANLIAFVGVANQQHVSGARLNHDGIGRVVAANAQILEGLGLGL